MNNTDTRKLTTERRIFKGHTTLYLFLEKAIAIYIILAVISIIKKIQK